MPISAYLQEIPRPFWIIAMVLGFIWHWPVGLAVLAYLIGSGRMARRGWGPGRWQNMRNDSQGCGPAGWGWSWRGAPEPASPAGTPGGSNSAFDAYRAETLRRLEEEQQEFMSYLERLRQARDKQEFDQFMADRRRQGPPPAETAPN